MRDGIIGFTLFCKIFLPCYGYKQRMHMLSVFIQLKMKIQFWRVTLRFSFMFQTFFLLYGLTGNPLYDQSWQIIYMFSLAIYMGYRHVNK